MQETGEVNIHKTVVKHKANSEEKKKSEEKNIFINLSIKTNIESYL